MYTTYLFFSVAIPFHHSFTLSNNHIFSFIQLIQSSYIYILSLKEYQLGNMNVRMKRRIYCFLISTLYIVSWVSTVALPFAPFDRTAHQQGSVKSQILKSPQVAFVPKQGVERMGGKVNRGKEEAMEYKGMSRLGSRPPNCEHRCGHCRPCIAIQVPTTTDHLGLQYANYEPEGWKCKCGSTFFNP